jgi:hypothetical protein
MVSLIAYLRRDFTAVSHWGAGDQAGVAELDQVTLILFNFSKKMAKKGLFHPNSVARGAESRGIIPGYETYRNPSYA